jgi:hypothetical protein
VTLRPAPVDWVTLARIIEAVDLELAARHALKADRKARRHYQGSHKRWSYEGRKLAERDYTPTPKGGQL